MTKNRLKEEINYDQVQFNRNKLIYTYKVYVQCYTAIEYTFVFKKLKLKEIFIYLIYYVSIISWL